MHSRYLRITVAMNSKQIKWLFGNNLTNGNVNIGRKSASPNMGDQYANADNTLKYKIECCEDLTA